MSNDNENKFQFKTVVTMVVRQRPSAHTVNKCPAADEGYQPQVTDVITIPTLSQLNQFQSTRWPVTQFPINNPYFAISVCHCPVQSCSRFKTDKKKLQQSCPFLIHTDSHNVSALSQPLQAANSVSEMRWRPPNWFTEKPYIDASESMIVNLLPACCEPQLIQLLVGTASLKWTGLTAGNVANY